MELLQNIHHQLYVLFGDALYYGLALLAIVAMLAERGIQFFMASHSYFVVKKLFLIAQTRGWSIPVISAVDGTWLCDDLKNGMPDNPIIAESIRLYQQEVEMALK